MKNYKKILTIDELVQFCEKQKFSKFSSKKYGYQLAVQVPTTFEEVENIDENHRGMMKLKFRIFHTGLNRNGSFVSKEAAEKAMNTIADRPVLAAIHQLDDGSWDFEGHEIEILENENGEIEYNYIESQVGSFTSEPAFWEHDNDLDKDYVCAYAYISEEYTRATDIIRKKNGTKNSCELVIDELAYNAKEHYLELKSFFMSGSTLLGRKSDGTEIGEGMIGSRADICDFSVKNNSVITENSAIEVLGKIQNVLSTFNIENTSRKEDVPVAEVELMENAEEAVVQEEQIAETTEGEVTEVELESTETTPEEVENVEENMEVENEVPNDDHSVKFSVTDGENTKDFSLSLNEKLYAMNSLVNETYGELDNEWYDVQVFEDEKIVEMYGFFTGKAYRQSYKMKKDSFQLIGDRTEVFARYLSQDEINALEKMKSDFSELQTTYAEKAELLEKYESEPTKMEILNATKYSYVAGTEEFDELVKNHFDLSVEDVTKKADEILLSYAESGSLKFSVNEKKEHKDINPIPYVEKETKPSRYGNLFSR